MNRSLVIITCISISLLSPTLSLQAAWHDVLSTKQKAFVLGGIATAATLAVISKKFHSTYKYMYRESMTTDDYGNTPDQKTDNATCLGIGVQVRHKETTLEHVIIEGRPNRWWLCVPFLTWWPRIKVSHKLFGN